MEDTAHPYISEFSTVPDKGEVLNPCVPREDFPGSRISKTFSLRTPSIRTSFPISPSSGSPDKALAGFLYSSQGMEDTLSLALHT